MKTNKIFLLFCTSLVLCSCNNQKNTSQSNSSVISSSSDYYKNDNYIVGKRIYDVQYPNYYLEPGSFSLEGMPNISIKCLGKFGPVEIYNSEELVLRLNSALYLADINQDGYLDACYTFSKGSGVINYGVEIYDLYNKTVIFSKENRGENNYYLDLDENNILCLEECSGSTKLLKLTYNVGRFLKNSTREVQLEPFTYDFKLKGIICEMGDIIASSSNVYNSSITICGNYFENASVPYEASDIKIKNNGGVEFTYVLTSDKTRNDYYTLDLVFLTPGEINLTVTLMDFVEYIQGTAK